VENIIYAVVVSVLMITNVNVADHKQSYSCL